MDTNNTRSDSVVGAYKQDKLARSAFLRIRELLAEFEESRAADARLARIGIVFILALIGAALYFFLTGDRITLS